MESHSENNLPDRTAKTRCGKDRQRAVLSPLILLVLWLSSGELALTQDRAPDAENLMALSFDELLEVDTEKVYGASKFVQSASSAPSSITVIDATQIRRFGYRTLAEIIRSVRGFYTSGDRNYDHIGARGFLRPGASNSRLLLLINGHRINDNIYDGGAYGTEFPIDVDLIDRVEIVRGPSSALYGNSAFFGVINVITRQSSDFNRGEVSAEAGSFETHKTRFTLSDQFRNGASLLLSGSYFHRRGQANLYYPEYDDAATNFGIARRRDGDEFSNLFSQFTYRSLSIDAGLHIRDKDIPTGAYETVFNHPGNHSQDVSGFINAKHLHQFSDDSELTSRLTYGHYDYNGEYIYEDDETGTPLIIPNYDRAKVRWLIAVSYLRQRFLEKHQAIGGFEYRYDLRQDQRNFDRMPPFSYLNSQKTGDVWSPYMAVELNLRTNLTLNAGIRHDHYDSFGGTTNPRAALIYQARPATTLKYIYGKAFRAPNAFELYYGDSGSTAKPNPALNPEEIRTQEFVWEQQLNTQYKTALSFYHYDIDNLISQRSDPSDDLLMFLNIEAIRAQGVEAEISRRSSQGIHGRLSYAYQQSEDLRATGNIINAPSHLVKANLIVPLWRDQISLGLETLFTSQRQAISGATAPHYWLSNLTLFGHRVRPGLDISLSVYNLFDQQYFDPGNPEHLQGLIEQDGRTFRLKLTYRF